MSFIEVDNVFEALGFDEAESHSMRLRSSLIASVKGIVQRKKLSPAEAAKLFDVSMTTMKQLLAGNFEKFTIDSLVEMLAHAGIEVEMSTSTRRGRGPRTKR